MAASHYTEAIAAALCDRVAQGQVLSAAARACGLTPSTVHGWYHRQADFRNRLDAARDRAAGIIGKTVQPLGSSGIGRPAKYRPETANEIAGRHASGEQLCDIAQAVGVAYGTILNWQALHAADFAKGRYMGRKPRKAPVACRHRAAHVSMLPSQARSWRVYEPHATPAGSNPIAGARWPWVRRTETG